MDAGLDDGRQDHPGSVTGSQVQPGSVPARGRRVRGCSDGIGVDDGDPGGKLTDRGMHGLRDPVVEGSRHSAGQVQHGAGQ